MQCWAIIETVIIFFFQNNPIVSFDGNFGLVHKRSSGKDQQEPKHGERLFVQRMRVDEYVADCNDKSAKTHERVSKILVNL